MTSSPTRYPVFHFLAAVLLLAAGPLSAQDITEQEETAIRQAVDVIAPSVVCIETVGGLEKVGDVLMGTAPTSGLVVDPDGFILSSAFAFAGKPASILVTMPDGRRKAARIVARDRSRMLVLLKVDPDAPLPVPPAAPREEMRSGQWAIAVGRAFEGTKPNVSVGIVSAVDRIWGKAIQTDAKISPVNYGGPLVDIQGRVLGILVPLSPQGEPTETAGNEWYDSGIGFAVPLTDVLPHLETLKQGTDLHAGLLGLSLKKGDANIEPAEVAVVLPRSPAAEAGMKAGDMIVQIDGRPVERQNQLKHLLGSRYAGDEVTLLVRRGEKQLEFKFPLAEKIEPYEFPFLGVLPEREGTDGAGVGLRWIYPDSPAEKAGLALGDRIQKLDGKDVADAEALRAALRTFEPGKPIGLTLLRAGGGEQTVEVTPASLPTAIAENPPPDERPADGTAVTGRIEIKIPEMPNACLAWVPDNYNAALPCGLLVLIPEPGKFDEAAVFPAWQEICRRWNLILLVPQPADQRVWAPTETEFVGRAIEQVSLQYRIDSNRIVTLGRGAGGSMALLCALRDRDRIRGAVAVDALWPPMVELPPNDPAYPLAVVLAAADQPEPQKQRVDQAVKMLREAKYPVTLLPLGAAARDLDAAEREAIARLVDSLDRM